MRSAAARVEAVVGTEGLLDAIDVAAFFMSVTRIVDADGHSSTLISVVSNNVERAVTLLQAAKRQRWLLAMCVIAATCIIVMLRR